MEPQKIYEQMYSRISDLNRVSFQYRTLYLALLAAYYTSLSFVNEIAEKLSLLPFSVDAAAMLIGLTAAAFVGVAVLYFFDCINQELVEHCIGAIRSLEMRNKLLRKHAIFSHHNSRLISFRIGAAITLFYFIPAIILFAFLRTFCAQALFRIESTPFADTLRTYCDTALPTLSSHLEHEAYKLYCLGPKAIEETIIPLFLLKVILICFAISCCFLSYMLITATQRLGGRSFAYWEFDIYYKDLLNAVSGYAMILATIFFGVLSALIFFEIDLAEVIMVSLVTGDFYNAAGRLGNHLNLQNFCAGWGWLEMIKYHACQGVPD